MDTISKLLFFLIMHRYAKPNYEHNTALTAPLKEYYSTSIQNIGNGSQRTHHLLIASLLVTLTYEIELVWDCVHYPMY